MINLANVFQRVLDLIVFSASLFAEELLQSKLLPLMIAPILIQRRNLLLCHQEQDKIGNLLDQFIRQAINLLMQAVTN